MTVMDFNLGLAGQLKADKIIGGAPYVATTIAAFDARQQPSENELAGTQYPVHTIAEIVAAKLHG